MDGFAAYDDSDDEEKQEAEDQSAEALGFKPAWQLEENDEDDEEDDDEGAGEDKGESKGEQSKAAQKEVEEPAAKKKKLLPSALDALSSVSAPAFLSKAPEPEPEEEEEVQVPAHTKELQGSDGGGKGQAEGLSAPKLPPAPPVAAMNALPNAASKKKQEAAKGKDAHGFNSKEKRKRDLGQASRGKNWVEEEKRILRQSGMD